jgi:hypothetical protein
MKTRGLATPLGVPQLRSARAQIHIETCILPCRDVLQNQQGGSPCDDTPLLSPQNPSPQSSDQTSEEHSRTQSMVCLYVLLPPQCLTPWCISLSSKQWPSREPNTTAKGKFRCLFLLWLILIALFYYCNECGSLPCIDSVEHLFMSCLPMFPHYPTFIGTGVSPFASFKRWSVYPFALVKPLVKLG